MERAEALNVAVNVMNMDEKAAKKMGTAQLVKKVERFMSELNQTVELQLEEESQVEEMVQVESVESEEAKFVEEVKVPKKRGRKPNPNKVVRPEVVKGEFVLGWTTPTGNRRLLKYSPVTRNGEPYQVVHDQELSPEKAANCRTYTKKSTAEKNLETFLELDPVFYAGLEVLEK